jgi:hypothetical protein
MLSRHASSLSRKELCMSHTELGQGDVVLPPSTNKEGDGQNGS